MDLLDPLADNEDDKDCDKKMLRSRLGIEASIVREEDSSSPILCDVTLQSDHEGQESSGNLAAYRVVHFNEDSHGSGGLMTSLSGSPGEANETRLALISADSPGETTGTVVMSGGQLYVISETTNIISHSNRSLAPRSSDLILSSRGPILGATREEKRRVTHNEVERRRRDKINTWIIRLGKILPDCPEANGKISQQSKGGILAKACDHITNLQQTNNQLTERLKLVPGQAILELELVKQELESLKAENAAYIHENTMLRNCLERHGISADDIGANT